MGRPPFDGERAFRQPLERQLDPGLRQLRCQFVQTVEGASNVDERIRHPRAVKKRIRCRRLTRDLRLIVFMVYYVGKLSGFV
jgi:hypothetical protein